MRKKVTSIVLAAMLSFGMLSGTGLNVYADEVSTEEAIVEQDVETATVGSAEEISEETTIEKTSEEVVEATEEAVEEATEETEEVNASEETEEAEESAEEVETEEAVLPAFSDTATVDDVTIKVSAPEGVFPEGAYLSVSGVSESEKSFAEDAVASKRAADTNVADSYTFDIKVLDSDGEELQPEDGNLVKVSFSMNEVTNENLDAIIYHIPDDGNADQLYTNVEGDTVSAMSDGFSLYTVEFSYGSLEYVMEGDSSVALSDILSYVGLSGDVTYAESSAPELFSVTDEGGIWTVKALQAFSTEETLTVTIDGVTYEIKVTDDPVTTYQVWLGTKQVTSDNKDNILDEVDADGNPTATFDPDTNTLTFNDSNPNIPLTNGESSVTAKGIDLTINAPNGVTLINPYLGSGISLNSVNSLTLNGDFTIKDDGTQTEKEIYSGGDIIINGEIIAGSVCSEKGNITINDDVTLDSIAEGIYAKEGAVSITGNSDIYSYSQGIKAKDEVSVTGDVTIQNKKYDGIFSEGSIVLDGKVNILTEDEEKCGIRSVDGNITITGDTDIEAGYNGIFVMDDSETGDKAIILSGENNKIVSKNWTAVSSGAFIIITGNITATGNNCAIAGYCGVDITGNVEASSKNFEAISSTNGSVIIDGDVTAKTDSSINGAIYAKNDVELKSGKWVLDGSASSGALNAGNKIIIADTHEIKEPEGAKLSTEGRNILNADSTRAAHVVLGRKKGVITFDLNGGLLDGQPTFTVEAEVGDTITIPTSIPVRDGYSFSYWKGSEYYPGDSYTITGDHTLTAQWEVDSAKSSSGGTGASSGSSSAGTGASSGNSSVGTNEASKTNENGAQNVTTTVNTPDNLTTTNDSSNNEANNTVATTDDTKKDTVSTDVSTKKDSSVTTDSGSSDAKAPAATVTTSDSTPNSTKNLTTNQKSGPATGDDLSMLLLLSLMVISLFGMIAIVRFKKSKAL